MREELITVDRIVEAFRKLPNPIRCDNERFAVHIMKNSIINMSEPESLTHGTSNVIELVFQKTYGYGGQTWGLEVIQLKKLECKVAPNNE